MKRLRELEMVTCNAVVRTPQLDYTTKKSRTYLPGFNLAFSFYLKAYFFLKYLKSLPMKRAAEPNSSSIRSNWLYLAILSEREAEPVLI
jgi:hypothetical protein